MSKSVRISIPHRLSVAEVKTRLSKGIGDFRQSPMGKTATLSDRWQGDVMHLSASSMGQAITGRIEVKEKTVEIEVDLPWVLAMLAGRVKGEIEREGRKLLEKK